MKMVSCLLTQSYLRGIFDYKKDGLYWKQSGKGRNVSAVAGNVSDYGRKITIAGRVYPYATVCWMWHYGDVPHRCLIAYKTCDYDDCRIEALEVLTRSELMRKHTKKHTRSVTGHKNIFPSQWGYYVRFRKEGKVYSKFFSDLDAAIVWRDLMKKHLWGYMEEDI